MSSTTPTDDSANAKEVLLRCSPQDVSMLWSMAGAIAPMTMITNWNPETEAKLEAAINVVVTENPILRGRLEKDAGDAMPGTGWRITADAHSDGFFEVFEGPGDFVVPDTLGERLSQMRTVIEPLMLDRCLGGNVAALADGSQLFKVVVMTLPGNHAIYATMLNHMIGDGATYYDVQHLLSCAIKGVPAPRLKWVSSPDSVMVPPHYNADDRVLSLESWQEQCGVDFAKMMKNPRVAHDGLLDRAAIAAIKEEAVAAQADASTSGQKVVPFVSTNDVVMAALAEVYTADIINIFVNMRGRIDGVTKDMACNGERIVFMPRDRVIRNPAFVRGEVLDKFWVYDSGSLPKESLKRCSMCGVTNWCQLTKFIDFGAHSEVIGHLPLSTTVLIPLDFCAIFAADGKGSIGMVHGMYDTPEFRKRVAASTMYSRITQPL